MTGDSIDKLVAAASRTKRVNPLGDELGRLQLLAKETSQPIGLNDSDPEPMDDDADEPKGGDQERGGQSEEEEEAGDDEESELPEMPPVDVEVMIVEGEEGDLVYAEARESSFPANRGDEEVFEVEPGELPPVPQSFFATEEEHGEQQKDIKVARKALIKKLGCIGRDIVKGMNELKMFSVSVLVSGFLFLLRHLILILFIVHYFWFMMKHF